jgi:hypothetical protein
MRPYKKTRTLLARRKKAGCKSLHVKTSGLVTRSDFMDFTWSASTRKGSIMSSTQRDNPSLPVRFSARIYMAVRGLLLGT